MSARPARGLGDADEGRPPWLPADTSLDAYEAQIEAYRRLGPERRVALMAQMCDDEREVCCEGIRARHPEYTPDQVHRAWMRLVHGDRLVGAVFPGEPLVEP